MLRNQINDQRMFDSEEGINEISKLYVNNSADVRHFLTNKNGAGMLSGLMNEQVYQLISSELGYSVPK